MGFARRTYSDTTKSKLIIHRALTNTKARDIAEMYNVFPARIKDWAAGRYRNMEVAKKVVEISEALIPVIDEILKKSCGTLLERLESPDEIPIKELSAIAQTFLEMRAKLEVLRNPKSALGDGQKRIQVNIMMGDGPNGPVVMMPPAIADDPIVRRDDE